MSNNTRKVVIISGSSSGIGRATAIKFAEQGWEVVATMRKPGDAGDLSMREHITVLPLDVTDQSSRQACVAQVIKQFGRIDALVNNAGYALVGPLEAMEDEAIRRQFETNVVGLMGMTREVLPQMRAQKSGSIVNIASVGGRLTIPLYSIYHGTKWAVEGFSESLSYELEPFNIKVRIIEPGPIKTDFYTRSMDVASKDGLTAYSDYVRLAMHNMNDSALNEGGTSEEVADVVFKATVNQSHKMRWPVGGGAPESLMFRKLIPLRMFMGVIKGRVLKKR